MRNLFYGIRSAFVVSLLLVTLLPLSASAANDISDVRMEFCQNGNLSNNLTFEKGTSIPSAICVRYTNLSSSSLTITSEVVDGYLMADGRRACRENDEAKATFGKTAKFKVGSQSVETITVTLPANGSVDGQISPGFSSPSSPVYGCVVTYVNSTGGTGISVVTRRAITLGFGGATSGSNIVSPSTPTPTATGTTTTSTGTTSTGTTATGTTSTGVTTPTATGTNTTPTPTVTSPTSTDTVSTDETGMISTEVPSDSPEATITVIRNGQKTEVDPQVLAIIQSNPFLSEQLRNAGAHDPTLASIAAALGSGGGSISVDTSSSPSSEITNPCGTYSDLDLDSEFCGYVRILSVKEVIRTSDAFEPDRPITRAELLKIAFGSASINAEFNAKYSYSDVNADDWWAPYVSTAKKYGYISQTNTEFRPNDSITRAEAMKILMNVSGKTGPYNAAYSYDDIAPTDWSAPYVSTAKKYGYISQTNNLFRPQDSITRAESGKIVVTTLADRLLFR